MDRRLSAGQAGVLALGEFRAKDVSVSTIRQLYRLGLITRWIRSGNKMMPPGCYRISALGKQALKTGQIRGKGERSDEALLLK